MSSWTQQKQLKRWVGAVNDMILTCIWLFLWIALIGGSRVLRFTFNTFGETSGSIKAAWVERRRQMSWTEAISQMAISICHVQFLPLSFCTVENNEFVASIIIRFDGSKTNQEKNNHTHKTRPRLHHMMMVMAITRVIVSVEFIVYDSLIFSTSWLRPWQSYFHVHCMQNQWFPRKVSRMQMQDVICFHWLNIKSCYLTKVHRSIAVSLGLWMGSLWSAVVVESREPRCTLI